MGASIYQYRVNGIKQHQRLRNSDIIKVYGIDRIPDTDFTNIVIKKYTSYFNKQSVIDNMRVFPQTKIRLCQWER